MLDNLSASNSGIRRPSPGGGDCLSECERARLGGRPSATGYGGRPPLEGAFGVSHMKIACHIENGYVDKGIQLDL